MGGLFVLSMFLFMSIAILTLVVSETGDGSFAQFVFAVITVILTAGWIVLFSFIIGVTLIDFFNNNKD